MNDLLYKPDKTEADIECLIAQHKNLIYYMLNSMQQLHNQDCESAAWEALWDAVCTFDIFSSTQFSTYACTLMRNAINDVLRKQVIIQKNEVAMQEYDEQAEDVDYVARTTNKELLEKIELLFTLYLNGCQPKSKAVLQAWRASNFEMNGSELAKMCSCTPSYVSRVKCSFRAYLQRKIAGF